MRFIRNTEVLELIGGVIAKLKRIRGKGRPPTRRDIKKALGASLKAEEQAIKDKYEKLDKSNAALSKRKSAVSDDQPSNGTGRVIRDSFTMPSSDYDLTPKIKKRHMKSSGFRVTKSELLRGGLAAHDAMADKELVKVIENLPKIKTGRPTG
jgi:hypothetical protein